MKVAFTTTLGAAAVLALAGIAASFYFVPSDWTAPPGIAPAAETLVGRQISVDAVDAAALVQTTERPLFSETRRPAPPEPVAEQAPEVDPLKDVVVYGLFQSGQGVGGAIVKIDGFIRRLRIGERAGNWTFNGIEGRKAIFIGSAGERRETLMRFLPQPDGGQPPIPELVEGARNDGASAVPGLAVPSGAPATGNPPATSSAAPATSPPPVGRGDPRLIERRSTNAAERAARRAARLNARP